MKELDLNNIFKNAQKGDSLHKWEIEYLLSLENPFEREKLFSVAREMRSRYFKNKVFLYGFVYFSTFCRNNCTFCFYRKSNNSFKRYRKSTSEIVESALALKESGVHLIDLTMGEDPEFYSNGFHKLIETVARVKTATDLPVMISPGVVTIDALKDIKDAGAKWYACYQETHNKKLFKELRISQSYDERWSAKVYAKEIGLLVEEGLLFGVGDTIKDAADSIYKMKSLGADQIRVMTFIPQKGTPLYRTSKSIDNLELNMIAVMRIMFPDRLIPASLDVEGIVGLKERLDAGANVVTSLIPAESGLMGVSQGNLDIAEGNRSVKGIEPILDKCGLISATIREYEEFISERQAI